VIYILNKTPNTVFRFSTLVSVTCLITTVLTEVNLQNENTVFL